MKKNNLLIVKAIMPMPAEILNKLKNSINEQIENGNAVVLPSWVEVVKVPDGVSIKHCNVEEF